MFEMGCATSCNHSRIIDSNAIQLNDHLSVELISSPLQLINYFKDKDNNLPKCIFIFGGSGSNKGEFIYEMICASWINYRNEQQFENHQQDCQKQKFIKEQIDFESIKNEENLKKDAANVHRTTMNTTNLNTKSDHFKSPQIKLDDDQKYSVTEHDHHQSNDIWNSSTQILSNRSSFSNISIKYQDNLNFVYSYIDIERLILDNLKQRIKELGDSGPIGYEELFGSNDSSDDEKMFGKKTELKIDRKNNLNENSLIDSIDSNDKKDQKSTNLVCENDEKLDKIDKHIDNATDKQIDHSTSFDYHHSKNDEISSNEKAVADLKNANQKISPKNIYSSITKETKKRLKRKRTSIRNSYWTEFLKACEEDFDSNQSKLNVNYNSRALKNCLFINANCITNNWVFNLIEKEIKKRNHKLKERFKKLVEVNHLTKLSSDEETDEFIDDDTDHHENHFKNKNLINHNCLNVQKNEKSNKFEYKLPEVIYIVNLIPNQINIFRHCLYLQQTPNLSNFKVNFIAINLISSDLIDLKKKDLDHIIGNTVNDELNLHYINYFRSINRLTDVQIRQLKQKNRIRITKGKKAIKIKNEADIRILFGALENNQEIDLSDFKRDKKNSNKEKATNEKMVTKKYVEKGNLLFLLDDIVDLGDLLLCIEDHSLEMVKLRNFIQIYLKEKEKVAFDRLNCTEF